MSKITTSNSYRTSGDRGISYIALIESNSIRLGIMAFATLNPTSSGIETIRSISLTSIGLNSDIIRALRSHFARRGRNILSSRSRSGSNSRDRRLYTTRKRNRAKRTSLNGELLVDITVSWDDAKRRGASSAGNIIIILSSRISKTSLILGVIRQDRTSKRLALFIKRLMTIKHTAINSINIKGIGDNVVKSNIALFIPTFCNVKGATTLNGSNASNLVYSARSISLRLIPTSNKTFFNSPVRGVSHNAVGLTNIASIRNAIIGLNRNVSAFSRVLLGEIVRKSTIISISRSRSPSKWDISNIRIRNIDNNILLLSVSCL